MWMQFNAVGRLGEDPELRYTPSGVPVCNFSIAIDRYSTDEKKKTAWVKVTAWRKVAENCAQYLVKGSLILVSGEVDAEGFADKNGEIRGKLVVTAQIVKFMGRPGSPSISDDGSTGNVDSSSQRSQLSEEDIPF